MKQKQIFFKDKNLTMSVLDSLHDETIKFKVVDNQHIYFSICDQTCKIKQVHIFCSESLNGCYSIYKITNDFKELNLKFSDTDNLKKDLDEFELELIDFYYNTTDIIIYGSAIKEKGYSNKFTIVIPLVEKIIILQ